MARLLEHGGKWRWRAERDCCPAQQADCYPGCLGAAVQAASLDDELGRGNLLTHVTPPILLRDRWPRRVRTSASVGNALCAPRARVDSAAAATASWQAAA